MESKERVGAVEYQSPSVWHEVHKQDNAPNIWDKLKDEERITFASQNWDTLPALVVQWWAQLPSKNDPKWHDPVTVQDTHVFILLPSGSWAGTRIHDVHGSFSNSLVPCGRETQWPPLVFTSMQLGWSAPPAGCQKGTSDELCFWPLTEGEVSVKYQLLERISEGLTFFSHENEDPHGTMCWHLGDTYSIPNQSRSCCCRFVTKREPTYDSRHSKLKKSRCEMSKRRQMYRLHCI